MVSVYPTKHNKQATLDKARKRGNRCKNKLFSSDGEFQGLRDLAIIQKKHGELGNLINAMKIINFIDYRPRKSTPEQ